MSLSRKVGIGLLGLIFLSTVILLLFALDYFVTGLHLSMYAVYILIIMTAIFAVLAIEDKDLLHAALYLAGSAVTLALLYLVLFAIWVAFFQLAIYAGAVTVIVISGISLTTRRGTGEIEEEDV